MSNRNTVGSQYIVQIQVIYTMKYLLLPVARQRNLIYCRHSILSMSSVA